MAMNTQQTLTFATIVAAVVSAALLAAVELCMPESARNGQPHTSLRDLFERPGADRSAAASPAGRATARQRTCCRPP
jgi:hypothetical protein